MDGSDGSCHYALCTQPQSDMCSKSDFCSWDDLDLDALLGEYTTDDEAGVSLSTPRSKLKGFRKAVELDMSSDNYESDNENVPNSANTPVKATAKSTISPTKKANKSEPKYKCPLCVKQYVTIQGFRGHVTKKHNRADIKGIYTLLLYNCIIIYIYNLLYIIKSISINLYYIAKRVNLVP